MSKLTIKGSFHHADSRKMSKEESVIAVKVFEFAQKAGRSYKADLLQSDIRKSLEYGDMEKAKLYHLLGELRNAGEYVSREGWKEGLTFGQACKNSRGGHNVKKDIAPEQRVLHRKALLVAGGDALRRGTWSAQTAFLNTTEEGTAALKAAQELLEQEA